MEEDVSRAIKQLEDIAIKAMKSGYLDDAAKVMHIAEEIERVDKSGVGAGDLEESQNEYVGAAAYERADEPTEDQSCAQPALASLNHDFEPVGEGGPIEEFEGPALHDSAVNIVPLNRYRMKRNAAVGDDMPDSTRQ